MKTYKYSLDRSSKKFQCPSCGKKTFVRYVENETQNYLDGDVGRCDRESKCGFHKSPGGNQPLVDISKIPVKDIKPSFHSQSILGKYGNNYQNNTFVKFLGTKFDPVDIRQAIKRYRILTIDYWKGATVFLQIDEYGRIRAGKVMLYDPITGNRIKVPKALINWLHVILKNTEYQLDSDDVLQTSDGSNTNAIQDEIHCHTNQIKQKSEFNLQQCLFGLHRIDEDIQKVIAVVESEKTAIMMSIYLPCYIWVATGQKSGFKDEMLKPIKHREILAYPDKSCFDDWSNKASELNNLGYRINCGRFTEDQCISDGDDLIDYMSLIS